jgi:hypothetical protein
MSQARVCATFLTISTSFDVFSKFSMAGTVSAHLLYRHFWPCGHVETAVCEPGREPNRGYAVSKQVE